MSAQNTRSHVVARRAELLAELFFQELDPAFISRPTTEDLGYDLLVGFRNERDGINTFAVEVKSTERPPASNYPVQANVFNRMAHSNIPGLLLVVDVKHSQLYYGWLRPDESRTRTANVLVPLVEIHDPEKEELKAQFRKADHSVAAAG